MKNQSLTAPENTQDIEADAEQSTRLSLHARLDRLINDPSSSIEDITKLGRLLSQMIRSFATRATHDRQLALAEGRLEVRRAAQAIQKAKMAAAAVTPAPRLIAEVEAEEPAPLEKAAGKDSKPKAQAKPADQPYPRTPQLEMEVEQPDCPSKVIAEVDRQSFVQPLCTGIWPFNTVIPATWQSGDPIPGELGEIS